VSDALKLTAGLRYSDDEKEFDALHKIVAEGCVSNLFNEQVAIGAIDFNNNTAMVNEERHVGVEFKVNFF
jgi:hypothetical protein